METTPSANFISRLASNFPRRFEQIKELAIPIVPTTRSFLERLRNLEKIDFRIHYFDLPHSQRDLRCQLAVQKLLDANQGNQGTLKHIKIEFRDPGPTETGDVIILPKMTNLESLSMEICELFLHTFRNPVLK